MDQSEVIPRDHRHATVIAVVERSALVRAGRRLMEFVQRAARSSRAGGATRELFERWGSLPSSARLRAIGTVLVVSMLVHVGVTVAQQAPPGWLWLVIPGIALAQGLVLLAASRQPRRNS